MKRTEPEDEASCVTRLWKALWDLVKSLNCILQLKGMSPSEGCVF